MSCHWQKTIIFSARSVLPQLRNRKKMINQWKHALCAGQRPIYIFFWFNRNGKVYTRMLFAKPSALLVRIWCIACLSNLPYLTSAKRPQETPLCESHLWVVPIAIHIVALAHTSNVKLAVKLCMLLIKTTFASWELVTKCHSNSSKRLHLPVAVLLCQPVSLKWNRSLLWQYSVQMNQNCGHKIKIPLQQTISYPCFN